MSRTPSTPYQSLENLKNRAFNCIYKYAQSTLDIANHAWASAERRERALQLATFIKKDLKEFKMRLENINVDFSKMPGKVRQHPHHPDMLKMGGQYISYINELETVVGSRVSEMVELMADDIDASEPHTTQQALS
ncbi:hypothetical protein D3C85_14570 [compost metagenome]